MLLQRAESVYGMHNPSGGFILEAPESCVLHGERSALGPESLKEEGVTIKGTRRRGQDSAL